jgi:hypothetical protein
MADLVRQRRRLEQRLCRDTAPEDACPAQALALDDGSRKTQLTTTDGAYVAGGPAAEEDHVERSHSARIGWNGGRLCSGCAERSARKVSGPRRVTLWPPDTAVLAAVANES